MRKVVVLPQPDGPTSTMNSLIVDRKIHVANGVDFVEILIKALQGYFGHRVLFL